MAYFDAADAALADLETKVDWLMTFAIQVMAGSPVTAPAATVAQTLTATYNIEPVGTTVNQTLTPTYNIGAYFDVMDYGAHADGVTNDLDHIQAAVTAAGGGPVYFPAGTYLLSTTFTVPSSTVLIGAGETSHLKGAVRFGSTSSFTDLTIGNAATSGAIVYGGCHDLTFTRVQFVGDVTGVGSHATTGFIVSSTYHGDLYNITYDHCTFATDTYTGDESNAFHAILTQDVVHDITFTYCEFEAASRISFEFNGRGGWWHDLSITNCTFRASCGEQLSVDMSPNNATPTSPYGVTVSGVVRGVESLVVTDNVFEGTGATVNGFAPSSYLMGLEFGCVYPYASDTAVGRSTFARNTVGRCASSWLNFSYTAKGCWYMTFQDNVFDFSSNPHSAAAHNDSPWNSAANLNYCTFDGNTYTLGTANNQPYYFVAGGTAGQGGHNTFTDEHWTKPSGTIGGACGMPFTDSDYTTCHFHLPKAVVFPASATGSGNVFDTGYTGGDGSMT